MSHHQHYTRLLLTATLSLALAGCSGAPSLPAVSPNPTVSITSSAGHELLTATRLDQNQAAQLTAEVKQAAADPAKAAALISELGGAGLLRAVVLGSTVKDAGLADAVRGLFLAGQPKLDTETAQRVASELANGLRVQDATQKANNALALSFLLRDSTLNPELLIRLAPGLIETDQQITSEKKFLSNQSKTWADVTSSGSSSLKNLFEGQDWAAVSDVLASYLTALGRDGVAGLAVFTDTALGATEPTEYNYLSDTALARQRYVIGQRSWAQDRFAALTAALEAATTSKETVNTPLASGLVSSIIEILADRYQGKTIDGQPLAFTDPLDMFTPDSLTATGAKRLANIITAYPSAVDYYLTRSLSGNITVTLAGKVAWFSAWHVEATKAPTFRRSDIKTVLWAICGTEEGYRALRDGFGAHYNNIIKNPTSSDGKENPQEAALATSVADAKTRGFLYRNLAVTAISRGATPTQVRNYLTAATAGENPAIPAYNQSTKGPVLGPELGYFTRSEELEEILTTELADNITTARLTQLAQHNPTITTYSLTTDYTMALNYAFRS